MLSLWYDYEKDSVRKPCVKHLFAIFHGGCLASNKQTGSEDSPVKNVKKRKSKEVMMGS